MQQKIKLIWDFRGPDADRIAEHHADHLKEFAIKEKLDLVEAGFEKLSEIHWMAYIIVFEAELIKVRDALKPNRGILA